VLIVEDWRRSVGCGGLRRLFSRITAVVGYSRNTEKAALAKRESAEV
jgi:hypothetical protein